MSEEFGLKSAERAGSTDEKRTESVDAQEVEPEGAGDVYRPEVDTSSIDERKLMRKIDLRLVPFLALLYLMNSLDRGAIGNARVRTRNLAMFLLLKACKAIRNGAGYWAERQAIPARLDGILLSLLSIRGWRA